MAIFRHIVGASASDKHLSFEEFDAFITDMFQEQIISFPAAIFVGEAKENRNGYYWVTQQANDFIRPNAPGSMMMALAEEEGEDLTTAKTLWYKGEDITTFKEALHNLPFGKEDICVCFNVTFQGGNREISSDNGAVIYALSRPFPVEYYGDVSTFQRDLAHFVVFYTSVAEDVRNVIPLLKPLLERYFGPDFLLEEPSDW